jgi:hypothetical protein
MRVSVASKLALLPIDAKDEQAALWGERFGAFRLFDDLLILILPLKDDCGCGDVDRKDDSGGLSSEILSFERRDEGCDIAGDSG